MSLTDSWWPGWVRPYRSRTVGYVLASVASVASVLGALIPVYGVARHGASALGWCLLVAFLVAYQAVILRVVLVGLFVSAWGIKLRLVHRTRTLPWTSVRQVWVGKASGYDAWAIDLGVRRQPAPGPGDPDLACTAWWAG